MDMLEGIRRRRSVRSFSGQRVPKAMIKKLVDAGRAAPSAGGLASQRFFVVEKEDEKKALADIAGQEFVADASHVIVVFADEKKISARYGSRAEFYAVCDGSAAVENILLAATALGLASVWVGAFDDDALKKFFKTELKPIAILPVGFEK